MNAGMLDRLVRVDFRDPDAQGPTGEPIETWVPGPMVWANKRSVQAGEKMRGGQEAGLEIVAWTIRHGVEVSEKDRVVEVDGTEPVFYDVLAAVEALGRREWVELTTQRFRPG